MIWRMPSFRTDFLAQPPPSTPFLGKGSSHKATYPFAQILVLNIKFQLLYFLSYSLSQEPLPWTNWSCSSHPDPLFPEVGLGLSSPGSRVFPGAREAHGFVSHGCLLLILQVSAQKAPICFLSLPLRLRIPWGQESCLLLYPAVLPGPGPMPALGGHLVFHE